jgi:hypothetical protein
MKKDDLNKNIIYLIIQCIFMGCVYDFNCLVEVFDVAPIHSIVWLRNSGIHDLQHVVTSLRLLSVGIPSCLLCRITFDSIHPSSLMLSVAELRSRSKRTCCSNLRVASTCA